LHPYRRQRVRPWAFLRGGLGELVQQLVDPLALGNQRRVGELKLFL
jgi:hypothetical protein